MTKDKIIQSLKTIQDPELGIDIVTLGLIYEVNIDGPERGEVVMTYTTPFCPFGSTLKNEVLGKLESLGLHGYKVRVVFDPPWEPNGEVRKLLRGL